MNTVCIIPARGGSKGIPRKNLIDFCGKPLLAWSIEQALVAQCIMNVYVTSEDLEILAMAKQFGAIPIQRPLELAEDKSSSDEALMHALREIENDLEKNIDSVVFLQATSPVRESSDIDAAVNLFTKTQADSVFSAAILDDFCIWKKGQEGLRSFTYDFKNRGRRQERDPFYLENGSIYVFKPGLLKETGNHLGGRIEMFFMPLWKSFEIDAFDDVAVCQSFMDRLLRA